MSLATRGVGDFNRWTRAELDRRRLPVERTAEFPAPQRVKAQKFNDPLPAFWSACLGYLNHPRCVEV